MATMAGTGQKQQRARQQLSCTACRGGKLRCNRQHPCDQCIKRSKDSTCEYLPPPQKKKQNRNTKDRIAHLEGLVVQLMNREGSNGSAESELTPPSSDGGKMRKGSTEDPSGAQSKESPQSDDSADFTSNQLSYLRISNRGHSSYRGSSHWEAILESIEDLRNQLEDEESEDEPEDDDYENRRTLNVIIGTPLRMTKEELISAIPPKYIADRLLWHWFNSTDPGMPQVHRPTFLKEYDGFWADNSSVTTMWISLLYSIMSLGARIVQYHEGTEDRMNTIKEGVDSDRLQELAAAALGLADFTRPQRYLIESLMIHGSCEYMKFNRGTQIWLMMSFVIRMALKMGYHRDGDNFSNLTPFESEMRRRVWNIVYTFDVLQSYQEGLPSMIRQLHSDTKTPRNILDTDFGPESTELPPSRPLIELSPISYGVVKNRLSRIFAQACDISQAIDPPEYDTIIELNQKLQESYEETPPALRFSSMNQAILDPPNLIFNRFKLELMFHKTRCVLNRRYMTQSVVGTKSELSRKFCVDAAIAILRHHEAIFRAAQDGGQLSQSRFYIASLNSADFLLAAMIICLELDLISKAPPAQAGPCQEQVAEMRSLLQNSYNIWKQPVNHFADTDKAVKAMEAMLRRNPSEFLSQTNGSTAPKDTPMTEATNGASSLPATTTFADPSLNSANGIYSNGDASTVNSAANLFGPISGMFPQDNSGASMDWGEWDKMMYQYPDPASNQDNLGGWTGDLGNVDLSGIPDFGTQPMGDASKASGVPATTAPSWNSITTQSHNIPLAGLMPFEFAPSNGPIPVDEAERIKQLYPGFGDVSTA